MRQSKAFLKSRNRLVTVNPDSSSIIICSVSYAIAVAVDLTLRNPCCWLFSKSYSWLNSLLRTIFSSTLENFGIIDVGLRLTVSVLGLLLYFGYTLEIFSWSGKASCFRDFLFMSVIDYFSFLSISFLLVRLTDISPNPDEFFGFKESMDFVTSSGDVGRKYNFFDSI